MYELLLEKISFTDNCLKEYWLSDLNLNVTNLEIKNSKLNCIVVDAFNSNTFITTLITLTIDNSLYVGTSTHVFRLISNSFKGLMSLTNLTIVNNPNVAVSDKYSLENLMNSLTYLKISNTTNTWYPSSLLSSLNFSKIITVDLQQNDFPKITRSSFIGIAKNVKTLILTNSKIAAIAVDTFANFESLEKLHLQNNLLTHLAEGIFNSVLPPVQVYLQGNKWDCVCNLAPMQKMLQDYSNAFPGTIKCYKPTGMEAVEVVNAELCSEETNPTTLTLSVSMSDYSPSDVPDCSDEQRKTNPLCTSTTTSTAEPATTESTTEGDYFYYLKAFQTL